MILIRYQFCTASLWAFCQAVELWLLVGFKGFGHITYYYFVYLEDNMMVLTTGDARCVRAYVSLRLIVPLNHSVCTALDLFHCIGLWYLDIAKHVWVIANICWPVLCPYRQFSVVAGDLVTWLLSIRPHMIEVNINLWNADIWSWTVAVWKFRQRIPNASNASPDRLSKF